MSNARRGPLDWQKRLYIFAGFVDYPIAFDAVGLATVAVRVTLSRGHKCPLQRTVSVPRSNNNGVDVFQQKSLWVNGL